MSRDDMAEESGIGSGMDTDRILDRLVNGAVYLFALWTLACHATLLWNGGLRSAVIVFMALCGLALALFRIWSACRDGGDAARNDNRHDIAGRDDALPLRTQALFWGLSAVLMFLIFPAWQHLGLFWGLSAVYLIAAFWVTRSPVLAPAPPAREPGACLVPVLAFGAVILALMVCRPDIDDAYHLNVAVTMAQSPGLPILSKTSMVFGEPDFFWLPPTYRFQTLETLVAAISWLTRIPPIAVMHWGLTVIGAIALILCLWRLFRQLMPGFAFWSLLATLFFLMADGGGNASFGNHGGIVRLHQGRILFLAALLPLTSAYALEFMRAPSCSAFCRLTAVQVASIGLSVGALTMAPLMVITTFLAVAGRDRGIWNRIGRGTLSVLYPLLLGILCIATMRGYGTEMPDVPLVPETSRLWPDAVLTVLGQHPMSFVPVYAVLVAWLTVPNAAARRYAIVLPLFVWLTIFNPWLSRWLADTIMPQPVYYRFLWLCLPPALVALVFTALVSGESGTRRVFFLAVVVSFPFILAYFYNTSDPFGLRFKMGHADFRQIALWNGCLLAGLLGFGLLALTLASRRQRATAGITLGLLALFFCGVPVFYVLAPDNAMSGARLSVGRPSLKVDRDPYAVACLINERLPAAAAVLAPDSVTAWIPTALKHARPLLPRIQYYGMFCRAIGREEAERRLRLLRAVSGQRPGDVIQVLQDGLERYPLAAICLAPPADSNETRGLLRSRGFDPVDTGTPLGLWVRREASAP